MSDDKHTFEEFNIAVRTRDAIEKIAARVVKRLIPPPRFAQVTALDKTNRRVTVEFPDEAGTTFTIPCPTVMPYAVGQTVRIAGPIGARYVDQVPDGQLNISKIETLDRITIATPAGSANFAIELPEGYGIYADNAGAGSDNTRLWINGPDGGEIVLGPRSGGVELDNFRIRSTNISLEGSLGGWNNVTFQNSWTNWGSGFTTVQYRKVGDIVQLRGLASKSATFSADQTVFNLPTGFRPVFQEIFPVRAYGNIGGGLSEFAERIDITSGGNVNVSWTSTGTTNWLSFAGIQFSTT